MAEVGIFAPGERVELIEGEVLTKHSPTPPEAVAIGLAGDALRTVLTSEFHVRMQKPLALGADSEAEPDATVVRGTARDYVRSHPASAVLVVEISVTTLAFDRGRKAALYAKAGIPEYWIVNLVDQVLEVHRDPGHLSDNPTEYGYRPVRRLGPSDTVSPLFAPAGTIRIADLLP